MNVQYECRNKFLLLIQKCYFVDMFYEKLNSYFRKKIGVQKKKKKIVEVNWELFNRTFIILLKSIEHCRKHIRIV